MSAKPPRPRIQFPLLVLLSLAALFWGSDVSTAHAGFVLVGAGQTISHLEDIPEDELPSLQEETGATGLALGFKYEYFSLFFLDMWTGDGVVVLYDTSSDAYWELSDSSIESITGSTMDELGQPWLYTFPLGWIVLLLVVFGFVGVTVRNMRELG